MKIKNVVGLSIFMLVSFFQADVSVSEASVVGTPPNLAGNTDIHDATVWQGENLILNGGVTVYPGGSLTLDGTSLIFASGPGEYYGVQVNAGNSASAPSGGVLVIKNNSSMTAQNVGYNTYVFAQHGVKNPTLQIENSTFSRMGKGIYGLNTEDPGDTDTNQRYYGLEIGGSTGASYFKNMKIENSFNGLYMWEDVDVEVSGCTFEDIVRVAVKVRGSGPNIHDNTFTNFYFGVYAENSNGLQVVDNDFNPGSLNNGNYVIDIMYKDSNFVIKGNTITNFQKGIVLNGVLDTGEGPHDGLIEDNTMTDGGGCGVGMNMGAQNVTIRHNVFQNVLEPIICNSNYSINHANLTIENNNIINTVAKSTEKGVTLSSASSFDFMNNSFTGFTIGRGFQNVKSIRTGGAPSSSNLSFLNTAFSNFAIGMYIEDLKGAIFRNLSITLSKTHDIEFYGGNSDIKFLNAQFDLSKIYFSSGNPTDIFLPYSYLDVKVSDQNGNPVSGATLTVTNEIDNANRPAIDIDGNAQSSFMTKSDGFTPLPSDAANSIAVLDYMKTSTTETQMTYSITAQKNGKTVSVTGINPTAAWYRATPDTHANTIQLVLDLGSSGGSGSTSDGSSGSSSSTDHSSGGNTGTGNTGTVPATTPATSPYPTGTLLKTASSFKTYVIIENKKKWIPTPQVFAQLGYQWTEIKVLSADELNLIPDYEDNLIRTLGDYKVYLVVNGVKRHIPNPEVFLSYGFLWEDVKDVPSTTVDQYQNTYLIQEDGTDKVYYLRSDGIRKLIPSTEIFNSYNDKLADIQIVSPYEMNYYPVSNLIKLGNSNDIYLIEGTTKKRIPNPQVFTKYHLNWNLVTSVNQIEFDFYSDGGEVG